MILSMIVVMLAVAGAILWWAVDGRYRFASGPKPVAPHHAVDWLPSAPLDRWLESYRPGWVAPLLAAPLLVLPGAVLYDGRRTYLAGNHADEVALCLGAMAIGLALVAWWAHRRWSTPPFIRVLRERPETIVWAYVTKIDVMNQRGSLLGQECELTLCLNDGRSFVLPTAQVSAETVLMDLRRRCPHVVWRYSDELKREYEASPRTFGARRASPPDAALSHRMEP